MKTKSFRTALMSAAAALLLAAPAFAQAPQVSNFQGTMAHLDQNGIALSYLDTAETFDACRKILLAVLTPMAVDNPDMQALIDVGASLWKQSGLAEIRGFGRSCRKDGDFCYTVKQFNYAPDPAGKKGFCWQLVPMSQGLIMSELAFTECRLALASNFDGAVLWDVIDRNLKAYASPDVNEQVAAQLAKTSMMGFDIPKMISSISGIGFFMNGPMSFTFAFKTKTPVIFSTGLEYVRKESPEYVKGNEIVIPAGMFTVTAFQHKDMLIITNDVNNIKVRLAGQKLALSADPTFQKYAAGLTANSCAWGYVAPGFCSQLIPFLLMAPKIDKQMFKQQELQNVINAAELDQPLFASSAYTKDGALTVVRTGSRPAALFLSSPECQSTLISFVQTIATAIPCLAGSAVCDIDDEEIEDEEEEKAPAPKKK